MDIKRVAFETRPVKSSRPAVSTQPATMAQPSVSAPAQTVTTPGGAKIDRREIAAIVDRFLAGRVSSDTAAPPLPPPPPIEAEAGSMYSAPRTPKVETQSAQRNGETTARNVREPSPPSANGRTATDFVSEDDVRRAIQKGEKIYITSKTIITPAARDIGEPAEIFAKL
jgi:hypothetical protein